MPDDEQKTPARGPAAESTGPIVKEADPNLQLPKRTPGEEDALKLQAEADHRTMEENQADETIPGGAYVVDGVWVDAKGEPLKPAAEAKEAEARG